MRKTIASALRKIANWLDPLTGPAVTIQGGGGAGPRQNQ